jgi:two-component sensor histidine kinase
VRNNLQMVSAMLHNYSRTGIDDKAREEVNSISNRVMTLAQIYDSLLGVGLSEEIDLRSYLQQLCSFLPGLQDDRNWKVELTCQAESLMLPLNQITVLGMVTNSYRHAFPNMAGAISLSLACSMSGEAILSVRDDGVGFDTIGTTTRRGIGLVRKLIEQMGGTVQVHSDQGTHWTLAFPVETSLPSLAA